MSDNINYDIARGSTIMKLECAMANAALDVLEQHGIDDDELPVMLVGAIVMMIRHLNEKDPSSRFLNVIRDMLAKE